MNPITTQTADRAEEAGIRRYLTRRNLARAAAEAEKRAEAALRLELSLSRGV